MHSQDRILILPVTSIGLSGSFLQRIAMFVIALIISYQVSYAQCPPDGVDQIPPTCLVNQFVKIVLDPMVCELATLDRAAITPPSGADNCDPSPTSSLRVFPGSPVPAGIYVIEYDVIDASSNSQRCQSTLIIEQAEPDALKCTGTINHSLNPTTCSGTITIQDVIGTNVVSCPDACIVTIMEMDGTPRDNAFTLDDVGETYQYQLCCGGVCCWGYVNVEYYGSPSFVCDEMNTEITSTCIEMDLIPPPSASSQCLPPDIILISEVENRQDCISDMPKQLIRTYQIITPQGPTNTTCVQTITIEDADLSNVVWPEKTVIGCMEDSDPAVTGVPQYCVTPTPIGTEDTFETCYSLLPDGLPLSCSVFVSYEDTSFDTPCGQMITRMWHVLQWTCGVEEHISFPQIIEISDVDAPTISCPADFIETTTTTNCTAVVTLPSATVADACDTNLDVSISSAGGSLSTNGGVILLPVGVHDVVYTVTDCVNSSQCITVVTVADLTPPVAICENSLKIGFGEIGGTYLSAYKINGGSYDDCDSVSYLIARMDDTLNIEDHPYADKILIECSDVDTSFMAILQVSDMSGNLSYCMVSVCVVDKNEGELICPAARTEDCNFAFDETNLSAFFGNYMITDNCPDRYDIEDVILDRLNDCGVGELTRTIRLRNRDGELVDECTQTITFEDGEPLVIPPNTFRPIIEREACRIPNPVLNFTPNIPMGDCNLVGISSTIDTIRLALDGPPNSVDNFCREFLRTWKVIDWCATDGPGSKADPFVFEQRILLTDNDAPTFESMPVDTMFCNSTADCDSTFLSIQGPIVSDGCGGDIAYSYRISKDGVSINGDGNLIELNFGVGNYSIRYLAFDDCGNFAVHTQEVEIKVCKAPTLSCVAGISAALVPVDTIGDEKPDANLAILETKHFVAAAFHPCGLDVDVSFDPINIVDQIVLSCDSITDKPYEVEIYAIDSNGNSSHCTSFVAISDNGLCPEIPSGNLINVQGRIETSLAQAVMNVEVNLDGDSNDRRMTAEDGRYLFASMPTGGQYSIKPTKSDDYLNGVSITDMILIQQHILGLKQLADPYLMLAADVNKSQSITIADLIMLQQIILGNKEKPGNDESWLFVDGAYQFTDPTQPFIADVPDSYFINELNDDLFLNFVGVKYGDVDGSVLGQSENRNLSRLTLEVTNQIVLKGQSIQIPIYTSQAIDLRGLHLEFNAKALRIDQLSSNQISIDNAYYSQHDKTTISIPIAEGVQLSEESPLFTLHVTATKTIEVKDAIQLINVAEAYSSAALQELDVELSILDPVQRFMIQDIRPNPWYDFTSIQYADSKDGEATIHITDTQGLVMYATTQPYKAGQHQLKISKDILPHPGVYFIHIGNGKTTVTEKMIKLE